MKKLASPTEEDSVVYFSNHTIDRHDFTVGITHETGPRMVDIKTYFRRIDILGNSQMLALDKLFPPVEDE